MFFCLFCFVLSAVLLIHLICSLFFLFVISLWRKWLTSSKATPLCLQASNFCSICVLNSDHLSCSRSISANSLHACCTANSPSNSTSASDEHSNLSFSLSAERKLSAVAVCLLLQYFTLRWKVNNNCNKRGNYKK